MLKKTKDPLSQFREFISDMKAKETAMQKEMYTKLLEISGSIRDVFNSHGQISEEKYDNTNCDPDLLFYLCDKGDKLTLDDLEKLQSKIPGLTHTQKIIGLNEYLVRLVQLRTQFILQNNRTAYDEIIDYIVYIDLRIVKLKTTEHFLRVLREAVIERDVKQVTEKVLSEKSSPNFSALLSAILDDRTGEVTLRLLSQVTMPEYSSLARVIAENPENLSELKSLLQRKINSALNSLSAINFIAAYNCLNAILGIDDTKPAAYTVPLIDVAYKEYNENPEKWLLPNGCDLERREAFALDYDRGIVTVNGKTKVTLPVTGANDLFGYELDNTAISGYWQRLLTETLYIFQRFIMDILEVSNPMTPLATLDLRSGNRAKTTYYQIRASDDRVGEFPKIIIFPGKVECEFARKEIIPNQEKPSEKRWCYVLQSVTTSNFLLNAIIRGNTEIPVNKDTIALAIAEEHLRALINNKYGNSSILKYAEEILNKVFIRVNAGDKNFVSHITLLHIAIEMVYGYKDIIDIKMAKKTPADYFKGKFNLARKAYLEYSKQKVDVSAELVKSLSESFKYLEETKGSPKKERERAKKETELELLKSDNESIKKDRESLSHFQVDDFVKDVFSKEIVLPPKPTTPAPRPTLAVEVPELPDTVRLGTPSNTETAGLFAVREKGLAIKLSSSVPPPSICMSTQEETAVTKLSASV